MEPKQMMELLKKRRRISADIQNSLDLLHSAYAALNAREMIGLRSTLVTDYRLPSRWDDVEEALLKAVRCMLFKLGKVEDIQEFIDAATAIAESEVQRGKREKAPDAAEYYRERARASETTTMSFNEFMQGGGL